MGPLGPKVGDGSAFCARNVDFAFVWTCLSHGFGSSAWIEGDVAAVAHHLRADLDQLLLQARQRPILDRFRRPAVLLALGMAERAARLEVTKVRLPIGGQAIVGTA
jgi:hypothetical protein